MALAFTPETAWTPQVDSNSVHATMELPFGFGLSIDQIQNEFVIVKNGSNVAGLNMPLGALTSSITVLSPTDTEGTINITILNSVLNATDPEHSSFVAFNMELTDSTTTDFLLVGNSRAVANTSIGQITLDPIKVNVSTGLNGLQGLKGYATIYMFSQLRPLTRHRPCSCLLWYCHCFFFFPSLGFSFRCYVLFTALSLHHWFFSSHSLRHWFFAVPTPGITAVFWVLFTASSLLRVASHDLQSSLRPCPSKVAILTSPSPSLLGIRNSVAVLSLSQTQARPRRIRIRFN
ncbi:hypothetical protein BDR07DRAFT_173733 [Suillus spraguei]|nr:hypothetical protein BDR07DRAFT_173733 [Suillus spraguei]